MVLDGVGTEQAPVGVRDVEATDESIHVLVGNLDKEMFGDYTEKPRFAHWQTQLTELGRDRAARMIRVRKLPKKLGRVEGLALGRGGRVFYVCDDEDRVRVLFERDGSPLSSSQRRL